MHEETGSATQPASKACILISREARQKKHGRLYERKGLIGMKNGFTGTPREKNPTRPLGTRRHEYQKERNDRHESQFY